MQHFQSSAEPSEPSHGAFAVLRMLSPTISFLLVSFSLGELGDGLNIFQGIYLVGIGWNEGAVGTALSLMGLTALVCETVAGDFVDRTTLDRRLFLSFASLCTAASASMIFLVEPGENAQHTLIFISKIVEGISSSFIGPCLAALTLATFGPNHFDAVMASNTLWGHVGSVAAAMVAGLVAYLLYPNIQYCFLVITASALTAVFFVQFLPEGDRLMGRGFQGKVALDKFGHIEQLTEQGKGESQDKENPGVIVFKMDHAAPVAASYWEVISDRRCLVLCLTGFFFHFANANVLLVLGELMGGDNVDGAPSKAAIPLIAGAIVLAQATMAAATWAGDQMTHRGMGRKPLFLAGLLTLPIRCALIILWKDSGDAYLLSTQILDGLGGGFFALLHPFLVADLSFGSGRFNLVMGLTASTFGLGATLSNFLGQNVAERYGYVASLTGSLVLSVVPIVIFGVFMPETLGDRGSKFSESSDTKRDERQEKQYVQMT